jgi:hypothetical protein
MMSRSSWAIAPMTVNIAWPIGLEVSSCSWSEMKATFMLRKVSSAETRCFTDRAKRSKRHTSAAWNCPAHAARMSWSRAGRRSLEPE